MLFVENKKKKNDKPSWENSCPYFYRILSINLKVKSWINNFLSHNSLKYLRVLNINSRFKYNFSILKFSLIRKKYVFYSKNFRCQLSKHGGENNLKLKLHIYY